MAHIISEAAALRRSFWVEEIRKLSGHFGDDSDRMARELRDEITREGAQALIDHLRLCGAIPESYSHDSSAEKLYAKYTDALLAEAFRTVGLKCLVSRERADTADVEAFAQAYTFVADAKSFRLSRTAKNQKDFKVQAMDSWKRGKPYAMVVCPIYQLPRSSSQIYAQATARNVCVFTYSHLAMLVSYASLEGAPKGEELLHEVFKTVAALNPSKDAASYWLSVNRTMLRVASVMEQLWQVEKQAAEESIALAQEAALTFLANERERIMRMTHEEALYELVRVYNIDNRIRVVRAVATNNLLGFR